MYIPTTIKIPPITFCGVGLSLKIIKPIINCNKGTKAFLYGATSDTLYNLYK